ncbi:phosphatidate cytidylyltransferase [Candidatus Liberibacter sp.]|uniref:phosphatidate cytidylyltransferase n=1 Tax=Candidatus Liberibacter sp. TaxID=34022 RepID=UPI0015F3BCE2|nr:phosphatidate cytidylyltransferase [Candidatus Liberibacter sp.]MBA5724455.1 phosphatidate cytidylyltransferase [Candidatus Liberibacter sp.]
MSRELRLRIVSGFGIACVFFLAAWIGGWCFRFFSVVIGLLVYYEWSNITKSSSVLNWNKHLLGWFVVCFSSCLVFFGFLKIAVFFLVLYAVLIFLFSFSQSCGFWIPLGILYSQLPSVAMVSLRGNDFEGFAIIFFIFIVVWVTDVSAYFIGRAIGGPKMAPGISPGKTWSGALGGCAFSIVAGAIISSYFFLDCLWILIILSVVISVFCQLGDLFESFVKRCFGVKQSGFFLPGHGGIMDRVDGLIIACLGVFMIAFVFGEVIGNKGISLAEIIANNMIGI